MNIKEKDYDKIKPIFNMLGFKTRLVSNKIVLYDNDKLVSQRFSDGNSLFAQTSKGKLTCHHSLLTPGSAIKKISTNAVELSNLQVTRSDANTSLQSGKSVSVILGDGNVKNADAPWINVRINDYEAQNILLNFDATADSLSATLTKYNGSKVVSNQVIDYQDCDKNPFERLIYFKYGEGTLEKIRGVVLQSTDDTFQNVKLDAFNVKEKNKHNAGVPMVFDANQSKILTNQLLTSFNVNELLKYVFISMDNHLPGMMNYLTTMFDAVAFVNEVVTSHNLEHEINEKISYIFKKCCHFKSPLLTYTDNDINNPQFIKK